MIPDLEIEASNKSRRRLMYLDVSGFECYKTVLILETPFWVAGAAESMEIGKIVIGASNKSGRRCKRSDEIQLISLMYFCLLYTSPSPRD